jgi:hypothetical protein
MQGEDQYQERTPDLVGKIRAMREAAEKEMNRFTRVDDYDVRRVVGHGPTPAPLTVETPAPPSVADRPTRHGAKTNTLRLPLNLCLLPPSMATARRPNEARHSPGCSSAPQYRAGRFDAR